MLSFDAKMKVCIGSNTWSYRGKYWHMKEKKPKSLATSRDINACRRREGQSVTVVAI